MSTACPNPKPTACRNRRAAPHIPIAKPRLARLAVISDPPPQDAAPPMGKFSSPLQFAAIASSLLWPLAAGVAVLVSARARAAARVRQAADLAKRQQGSAER
jgi:hypothetical protein